MPTRRTLGPCSLFVQAIPHRHTYGLASAVRERRIIPLDKNGVAVLHHIFVGAVLATFVPQNMLEQSLQFFIIGFRQNEFCSVSSDRLIRRGAKYFLGRWIPFLCLEIGIPKDRRDRCVGDMV